MKNLSVIIGKNLLAIRKKNNLSLDNVAKLTGVSKPMLGQIERGITNPSVTTLWKIATGLNVSFTYFIEGNNNDIRHIAFEAVEPLHEHENGMSVYPIFPYDEKRRFEIFTLHLKPGCYHTSAPHNADSEEYVLVNKGELEIEVENRQYLLSEGDALSFSANIVHTYRNNSNATTHFQNIIFYYR